MYKYFFVFKEEVKKLYKSVLTKGTFAQNFSFSLSGNIISILSQVIFAPIISRIYGPEAYGVFSIINATATNLAIFSTLRLEGAIVLPKEEEEFKKLVKTTVLFALSFSSLVFFITLFFGSNINSFLQLSNLGYLIYVLGPFVFLTALMQITGNWVIRKKAYKDALYFGTPVGIGTRFFNVFYGLATTGASHGLILTDIISKLVTLLIRFKYIIKEQSSFIFSGVSWVSVKATLKKFKQFPLYDMPGLWLNMFSGQLPIYMLTLTFGANPVGQYGFATSLLDIPMRLLGYSIAPVFLQKATETFHNNPQDLGRITADLYKKLLLIGLLPFTLITVFSDQIFHWIFGPQWVLAGTITSYLGYFYLFRLISSPLSSILVILSKQSQLLVFNVGLFVGRAFALIMGLFMLKDIEQGMLLFSIINSVAYLLLSFWILIIVKAHATKLISFTVILIAATFCFLLFLKGLWFNL